MRSGNTFTTSLCCLWLSLACLTPLASAAGQPANPAAEELDIAFQAQWNGETLGTGSRRPTADEWAWGEANLVKAREIKLNRLGLDRVNAHRRAHGQPLLRETDSQIVPIGSEVTGVTGDAATTGGLIAPAGGTLPTGVDNSTLNCFPPIRSQGSLNSCAQFSAVYYTLTHMTALARGWDAKNGGDAFRFSPKWTYNMLNGGANQGTWHYDAYAIAQKHGLATWLEFPYDGNYLGWCLNPDAWLNALNVRADQSGKVLAINGDTGLGQLKQLLVNGYVLNFATYINSWVWTTIANDPTTPADDALAGKACVSSVNGTSGGHSMTIVGYNDDIWVDLNVNGLVDAGEKGALRIANSWGTGWGESGYAWVAYQALRTRNPAYTGEGLAWYDEATWVTAKASYAPKMVAQFTLNHLKRSQLNMTLGTSATTASTPSTTWSPTKLLAYAGGAYAFDGTTTARDGVFCLDFTDLVPNTAGSKRYYLGMYDSTAGDLATVSQLTLLDLAHGKQIPCSVVPRTSDAAQTYAYVDYDFSNGAVPPEASASASPPSGNIPLIVNFDGSQSVDPGGQIMSYAWTFGDGTTANGSIAQHTYTQAGSFTATLTVTDSEGLQSSSSLLITAIDPNVLNGPSGLTATASGGKVTLKWNDNSGNETGFCIERTLKAKTGPGIYTKITTTGANATTYADTVAPSTYYYRVQACNTTTGKTSAYSNAVSLRVR